MKTVIVLSPASGPTGTFEGVNILPNITGPSGLYPQWQQATGNTGPAGILTQVYNIGPTGVSGAHKSVIIVGGEQLPPAILSDGSGGTYILRADGLYVHSTDASTWILCGDSDGAFGVDATGNYYGQPFP